MNVIEKIKSVFKSYTYDIIFNAVFISIVVYLFFQYQKYIRLLESYDIQNYANLGDAIAGLTTPLVTIFGSYLVYLSFRQQLKANLMQQKALNEEMKRINQQKEFSVLYDLFKDFKLEYDKLESNRRKRHKGVDEIERVKGEEAFFDFCSDVLMFSRSGHEISNIDNYGTTVYLFSSLEYIIGKLIATLENESIEKEDYVALLSLIVNFYMSKMSPTISQLLEDKKVESNNDMLIGSIKKIDGKIKLLTLAYMAEGLVGDFIKRKKKEKTN